MALKMNKTITAYGKDLVFNDAYIKVGRVDGDKTTLVASVDYFDHKDGLLFLRSDYVFPHEMNNKNAIAQAYEHLKTLSEFADAVDC